MHVTDEDLIDTLSQGLPGGPLLAAVYARVDTAAGWTRMLTPLGNYLIARPAARAKAHQVTEETEVPLDAAMVLVSPPPSCTSGPPTSCSARSTTTWAPFPAPPSPASTSARESPGNR